MALPPAPAGSRRSRRCCPRRTATSRSLLHFAPPCGGVTAADASRARPGCAPDGSHTMALEETDASRAVSPSSPCVGPDGGITAFSKGTTNSVKGLQYFVRQAVLELARDPNYCNHFNYFEGAPPPEGVPRGAPGGVRGADPVVDGKI
eukprot:gene13260-biopygen18548